jgi:SAM-dependent MidA family methyltransferase
VTLCQEIIGEIRERGPIPFSRYMELCLYHPELGYYSRSANQFGKAGDFYTASDVHAVFGRLLARQFDEMWRVLGSPERIEILELGPGRGLFAQDVLDWSEKKFPEFFRTLHYSLLERSPALRRRLQLTLDRHLKMGKASLQRPLDDSDDYFAPSELSFRAKSRPCPERPRGAKRRGGVEREPTVSPQDDNNRGTVMAPEVPIIIFANEFFDALPVEILSTQGTLRIRERGERLAETWAPASQEELEFLDRYGVHPEAGERIEVPLAGQRCMSEIAGLAQHGFILAIDYGYTHQEQLAGRHRGTLATYRQHSESSNPYQAPGEQDITAHVNFTALADAAAQQGMTVQPLLTQSQFLMGIGEHNQFLDAFEECRLPQERAKVALQLKHLITPEGMGETFHVLLASKGVASEKVAGLSGLGFGKRRPDSSLA